MEHATYASRLRYLSASEIDNSDINFKGLDVRGSDDSKLGDIDGFIVDPDSGRVFYTVVDSGGWFTSRRFLLPAGHAIIDRGEGVLRVDVPRDALAGYPEFDRGRFEEFSDEDLRTFERRMAAQCCPDEPMEDISVSSWQFDSRRHYRQPDWWSSTSARHERFRPAEAAAGGAAVRVREEYDRELVTARDRTDRDVRSARDEDLRPDDVSPHLEGRAQPGDVLGLETGGERTYIGDTADDENNRRRDAEKAARDIDEDEPRRSER